MLATPKPRHLEVDYAAQFTDPSVIAAYHARPPYPHGVFTLLGELSAREPRNVLELGCGSGDLTHGLAPLVDRLDAVDPSEGMLAVAQRRMPGARNVHWFEESAESFEPECTYALAVAAESLHWMDWAYVLPKLARALAPEGMLAVVTTRSIGGLPWNGALRELIARYSTNRDYQPYDIVQLLTTRGLFHEQGRRTVVESGFRQPLDGYIESFHSRNGFSRDRMRPEVAAAFDAEVRALVNRHQSSNVIAGEVTTTVVWGRPQGATRKREHSPKSVT